MQQVEFDEDEQFERISSFYKEKSGKYQVKKAEVVVMCEYSVKEEKISKVELNLSNYIGKGVVKDTIQLYGNAYFLDFEITVELVNTSTLNRNSSQITGSDET